MGAIFNEIMAIGQWELSNLNAAIDMGQFSIALLNF